MMETVRAFALERLAQADELDAARRMHANHFASIAAQLDWRRAWATREDMIRSNRRFVREQSNFREALAWATSPASRRAGPESSAEEQRAAGLALLASLWGVWRQFDSAELRHWLGAVLDRQGTDENMELGVCLYAYAYVLKDQEDLALARQVVQRSVTMLLTLDTTELGWSLLCLSDIEAAMGHADESRLVCEELETLARGLGDNFLLGNTLDRLAGLEQDQDNWEAALRMQEDARQVYEAGGWYYLPIVNHNIAWLRGKLGQSKEAHQLMSTQLQQEARDYRPMHLLWLAEDYAIVLADVGFDRFTPLLLGACDTARQRIGIRRDQREERSVSAARVAAQSALTPIEWANAYARGRSMMILAATDEALWSTAGMRI